MIDISVSDNTVEIDFGESNVQQHIENIVMTDDDTFELIVKIELMEYIMKQYGYTLDKHNDDGKNINVQNNKTVCFCLPVKTYINNGSISHDAFEVTGYNCMFLCGDIGNVSDVRNRIHITVTHELLHTLGLPHTFRDEEAYDSKYRYFFYKQYCTDNLMDYASNEDEKLVLKKTSIYKWQWDIINKN